ncbi:MAG: MFS transporter [Luteitalea sp.]|nr:MFS transporter [Luteitalea sp.]
MAGADRGGARGRRAARERDPSRVGRHGRAPRRAAGARAHRIRVLRALPRVHRTGPVRPRPVRGDRPADPGDRRGDDDRGDRLRHAAVSGPRRRTAALPLAAARGGLRRGRDPADGTGQPGASAWIGAGIVSPRAKWWIVGLLFAATLLNYLDRQTLAVSSSLVLEDLRLHDGHFGQWLFAFFIAYGVAQIVIGPVLDRFSVVWVYAVAVAAWSLAGASAALASGFWSMLSLRLLLGICESPNWPLALRVVARIFPPGQRPLANGLFQCGTSVGALVAPPIIVHLATRYHWRVAFVVVGLVGLLWTVVWLATTKAWPQLQLQREGTSAAMPSASRAPGAPDTGVLDASPSTVRHILRSPALWGLLVATCFLNPLQYFYISWLPRFFDRYAGVGFGQELANRLVIVYLALDVGLVLGGWLVVGLTRRLGVVPARRLVATVGALCMTGVPIVSWLRSVDFVTVMICVATFGLGCFMVNYLAFASEVSATKVSTATGLLGGAGSLAGAAFMWLVGDTVMRSGGFAFAFAFAGVMPLVALGGLFYATRARPTRRLLPPDARIGAVT